MQEKKNISGGDRTQADAEKWMDGFTRRHLEAWIHNQFDHTDESEHKLETILDFLNKQDAEDREHYLDSGWWNVLTSAEFGLKMTVNPHKA